MSKILITALFSLFLVSGFYGCTKDNDLVDVDNIKPNAVAGIHHELTFPIDTVYLIGSGTDTDGVVTAYLWSQVSGPKESIIENPGTPTTKVQFSQSGSYLFQLMVIDNGGATGVDTVSVLVKPSAIDSLTLQANLQAGYMDLTFAGNDSGGNYTDPNGPEIDASAWTSNGGAFNQRAAFIFNFTQLPANATILSAKLNLYSDPTPLNGNQVDANYGSNNAIYIERVISSWNTSSAWANQPATTATNQILIPHTNLPQLDLIGVDVTSLVKDMLSNTDYGFGIRLQSEVTYTSRLFCGARYADTTKHPSLKIVYQIN
jgi:hypothetical protein